MLQDKNYWHETAEMPQAEPLTPLPERADVAIIGGGFTGLSAARTLARKGVRAAVLEANTIGWGASSRNGGMVLTGLKLSMPQIRHRYGAGAARELFQASLDSIDTVERLVREEQIECGFARSGHMVVASKPAHFHGFIEEAEYMSREHGHTLKVIERGKLHEEVDAAIYHGGLLDSVSGGLHPARYVAGLARAAARAGATLCARAQVTGLGRRGSRFVVSTSRGELQADYVLAATSGYTGNVTPRLQKRIIPVGSFIIATERLDDALAHTLIPRGRMIYDSRHYLNYFRVSDGRMIFGGRAAFFPESAGTIRQSARILQREMVRAFPQLAGVEVEFAWGGTLDFAFDMMPHTGQEGGLFYALGYAGHGVAMATHLGHTVAEAILSGSVRDHPLARIPFPTAPLGLYNGRPWFLPLAGLWQRFLDVVS